MSGPDPAGRAGTSTARPDRRPRRASVAFSERKLVIHLPARLRIELAQADLVADKRGEAACQDRDRLVARFSAQIDALAGAHLATARAALEAAGFTVELEP